MFNDLRGMAVSSKTLEGVGALDHAIEGYLCMAVDTGERLKAVYAEDAQMPMADILRGYFFMLMAVPSLKAKASQIRTGLERHWSDMTPRERMHADAMHAWTMGLTDQALGLWETILLAHPLDILALRLAHHGYFYRGDSQNLRDVVSRVQHAWDDQVPGYGYVEGMQAFGLEETHAYAKAIDKGHSAVARTPKNPWAIHAVAHVHEMTDTPEEGIAWLVETEANLSDVNNFKYHVWWHRALMHLDLGQYDKTLELYDQTIWDPVSDEYLDLCNNAALLMRLELHGIDVADRWQDLAEKCRHRKADCILTFIDAHFALVLAAVDDAATDPALDAQQVYAQTNSQEDNARVASEVGVELARGLVAYQRGHYEDTIKSLLPIRYSLPGIGGSHAQRDLFSMILLDATLREGRTELARSLAAERRGRQPTNSWSKLAYDRAMALT